MNFNFCSTKYRTSQRPNLKYCYCTLDDRSTQHGHPTFRCAKEANNKCIAPVREPKTNGAPGWGTKRAQGNTREGATNEHKGAPGWEQKMSTRRHQGRNKKLAQGGTRVGAKNEQKEAPGREPKMRRPLGLQMPLVYTPTHIVENKQ